MIRGKMSGYKNMPNGKSFDKKTVKRLISYMTAYKLKFSIVIVCIILILIVLQKNKHNNRRNRF